MDPITIAALSASVISALVPFLQKGGEKLVEKAAEEGFNKRGEIWGKVKGLFQGSELITLNLLEGKPESEDFQNVVAKTLETHLEANPAIKTELSELLKQLETIQKRNISTIENEDIKAGSRVSNEVKQSPGHSSSNESSIKNKNIENSVVENKVSQ